MCNICSDVGHAYSVHTVHKVDNSSPEAHGSFGRPWVALFATEKLVERQFVIFLTTKWSKMAIVSVPRELLVVGKAACAS